MCRLGRDRVCEGRRHRRHRHDGGGVAIDPDTVRVELGDASYDVLVGAGLLEQLPKRVSEICPAAAYAVISDTSVSPHHAQPVCESLGAIAPATLFTFPAGEWNKSRDTWAELTDRMLAAGLRRDTMVVAVGGGVVGDVAGFVAATYLRGIPIVQVPTSLLAMIDSSVGGKTAVDVPGGKNLVGAFHQPRLVVADTATLMTLPDPHLSAGLAEALKHGVIRDADYFEWILEHADGLLGRELDTLASCVHRSVAIKAQVVAADERDSGIRSVLNFGHTVAHALESVSGYALLHGEAVALGMLAESRLGAALGVSDPALPDRIESACERLGLPLVPPELGSTEDLFQAMLVDKKSTSGTARFALPRTLGSMAQDPHGNWHVPADRETIDAALAPWV